MINEQNIEYFDAIKILRDIRDNISIEIKDMSFEEEKVYIETIIKSYSVKSEEE